MFKFGGRKFVLVMILLGWIEFEVVKVGLGCGGYSWLGFVNGKLEKEVVVFVN